jgi:hypothetical protein
MRRLLVIVLSLALGLAAVSFVAAPYVAFFALRSAADAQDVQGLNQLVDFDAVRTSLKAGLTPGQAAQPAAPPSVWQNPIAALQSAMRPVTQPAPSVEPYLTPSAIANLTRGEGRDAIRPQPPAAKAAGARAAAPWPSVKYWGFNRCRLAVHADGRGDTVFTFERRGPFTWRLVQIGLPAA